MAFISANLAVIFGTWLWHLGKVAAEREEREAGFVLRAGADGLVKEALDEGLDPQDAFARAVAARLEQGEIYAAEWLRIYHGRTASRAGQSFVVSLVAAFLGFAALVAGAVYFAVRSSQGNGDIGDAQGLAMGALGALSAALSGYVVRTFMRVHEISVRQLNRYFDHPARMNSLFMAWRMAQTLEPGDPDRSAAVQTVISEMSSALTGPPASTDPDAPADK